MSKKHTAAGAKPLTQRQRSFAEEYLNNGRNGTEAYLAVYNSKSRKTAGEEASRLLKLPAVAAIIAEAERAAAERTKAVIDEYAISRERVMRELAFIGFSTVDHFLRRQAAGTTIVDLTNVTPEAMRSVQEIRVEEFTAAAAVALKGDAVGEAIPVPVKRIRLKLYGKREALAEIARIEGYAKPERHELSGAGGGPIETKQLQGFGREIMEQRFLEVAERRQAAEAAGKAAAQTVDTEDDGSVH